MAEDINDDSGNGGNDVTVTAATPAVTAAPQPTLMSSFFPSPPSYHAQFTSSNLILARKLVSHDNYKRDYSDGQAWQEKQSTILAELGVDKDEVERVKEVDLASLLEPPDVALIEQDGHWQSFGQIWPIHEALPSLEEMGVQQLYKTPITFEGRRQALHTLLHSLLHIYLRLLSILTAGPPSLIAEQIAFNSAPNDPSVLRTQADSAIEHLRLTAVNVHHLANEWRPVQARETMRLMGRNQVDNRRERIEEMRRVMGEIRGRLEGLKTRINKGQEGLVEEVQGMDLAKEAEGNEEQDTPLVKAKGDRKAEAVRRMLAVLDELGS